MSRVYTQMIGMSQFLWYISLISDEFHSDADHGGLFTTYPIIKVTNIVQCIKNVLTGHRLVGW